MYYTVIIVGKPGACKTTSSGSVLREANQNGLYPCYESDRNRLEKRVIKDTANGQRHADGSVEGEHSILFDGNKPVGRKVFQVTDGSLLNKEHDEMIRIAMTHHNHDGVVMEYALGTDVHFPKKPDLPLLQSGESLLRRLQKFRITGDRKVIILEIDAEKDKRLTRNGIRIDGMKPETINTFFGDGCEFHPFSHTVAGLGITYFYIDNNPDGIEGLIGKLEKFHTDIFRPVLEECRSSLLEGQPASIRSRDRR